MVYKISHAEPATPNQHHTHIPRQILASAAAIKPRNRDPSVDNNNQTNDAADAHHPNTEIPYITQRMLPFPSEHCSPGPTPNPARLPPPSTRLTGNKTASPTNGTVNCLFRNKAHCPSTARTSEQWPTLTLYLAFALIHPRHRACSTAA
jgi:hypothetical protein